MPMSKAEAHRALELLEDYYARLDTSSSSSLSSERELKSAIERVIRIFKSRLFQALLDIQEFYEVTLMDESKSIVDKTHEAAAMADKWEANPSIPFGNMSHSSNSNNASSNPTSNAIASMSSSTVTSSGPSSLPSALRRELAARLNGAAIAAAEKADIETIVLDRGLHGLGISIAGGVDTPHAVHDTAIFVTKVIPGGAAALDGRLKEGDVITRVNEVNVQNVSHAVAVEALKKAGNRVALGVRKNVDKMANREEEELMEVTLFKGSKGLGFTIAGGIGNQHRPGDNGIYVTKILEGGAAAVDGRIEKEDRLVCVKNFPGGPFELDNCTHEEAVTALKKCKDKVVLVIGKSEIHPSASPTIGQINQMPVLKRSVSDEELMSGPRDVLLYKGAAGLGFNIVGGEDGEGIFISFILAGGPADVSGEVRRGDKILSVNGVDLSTASHEDAAVALKNSGNEVVLKLLFCPEEYERFETKIHLMKHQVMSGSLLRMSEKKSLYVRALFSYEPSIDEGCPSRGLAFSFGDILHVINASDEDWWQAKLLDHLGSERASGLIPSRNRWEKKLRAKERNVRWDGDTNTKRSNSLKRIFKGGESNNGDTSLTASNQSVGGKNASKDFIPTYELVQQVEIDYTRPVIVLGPLKDVINDQLISDFPDKFASCVPHTTRPRRDHEMDGRDYHFVASRESMERDIQNHKFIEAGQYNNNLYGTSIASVKEVAESGRHCILDVSGNAIKRIQASRLYPIAIFVRASSADLIRAVVDDTMTDEHAEKSLLRGQRLEAEFLQNFTAIVEGATMDDIYRQVKAVIEKHATSKIWVPANEMF